MFDFEQQIDRTTTNAEKYELRLELFGTEDLIPMWVADMDLASPPCVQEAIKARAQHPIYGYEEMPLTAFEAQAQWMKAHHGLQMNGMQMLFSPSVVASMNVAIQAFTNEGDGVIYQPPVYHPFAQSIKHNNRRLLSNPLIYNNGAYAMNFEQFEQQCREGAKLFLLCSPHNPIGRLWKQEELAEIARICSRYGVTVFADEIHADLLIGNAKHLPFSCVSDEAADICISAQGPGKTFNLAGLSISTVHAKNRKLFNTFKAQSERIHFAQGTVFGHVGFEAAYREGETWYNAMISHLKSNRALLKSHLEKTPIALVEAEATYLAWLDCSALNMSDKLLRQTFIEKAKLGLSPGITFGKEGSGFMRLNYAVSKRLLKQALSQIDTMVAQL